MSRARTVAGAQNVHGKDPQLLIEKIVRERIYESLFWKERCFGLTAATILDRAVELRFVGGVYANVRPTEFVCLALKLLQIQPELEIIVAYIEQREFKYLRALGAFYLRLTASARDIYVHLEPLLTDFRRLRLRDRQGKFVLTHMDEFVDQLMREERVLDTILPRLTKRYVLEEMGELEPFKSFLEDELLEMEQTSDEDIDEESEEMELKKSSDQGESNDNEESKDQRESIDHGESKENDEQKPDKKTIKTFTKAKDLFKKKAKKKKEKEPSEEKTRENISVSETNRIRAELGLKPLK